MIRLVFQKFRELGSARQVLLWMASQNIHFPYPSNGRTLTSFEWRPIRYRNVIAILKNPFYAGVYAYGKSEKRTEIVDGRARKSYGHRKPMDAWEVFIKDHHEGYISWAEFERNQARARRQRLRQGWRHEVGTRRARAARRTHLLRALRSQAQGYLHWALSPARLRCESPNLQLGRGAASGSLASASTRRSPPRCCAPLRRWRSRRRWRPSAC